MIKFVLEGLPTSSNQAWINLHHKGRTLSPAAKKYKNETQTYIARTYPNELKKFVANRSYTCFFRVHVAELENKTFGKKNGAESRYKKNDATNRIKLLEDILSDVTGVDDSATLTFVIQKVQANPVTREFVEVFVWDNYEEESPFNDALRRL